MFGSTPYLSIKGNANKGEQLEGSATTSSGL
jgi:hypothetical protein